MEMACLFRKSIRYEYENIEEFKAYFEIQKTGNILETGLDIVET